MSLQQQVNMYFRNQGRCSTPKPKAEGDIERRLDRNVNFFTFFTKFVEDATSIKRNLDFLKSSKENDFLKIHTKNWSTSHSCRRHFIQHEAKSIEQIIEQCPFLAKPDHVSYAVYWYMLFLF